MTHTSHEICESISDSVISSLCSQLCLNISSDIFESPSSLWDVICDCVAQNKSFLHYEADILQLCIQHLKQLSENELKVLWYDEVYFPLIDFDYISFDVLNNDGNLALLARYGILNIIFNHALSMEHKPICNYNYIKRNDSIINFSSRKTCKNIAHQASYDLQAITSADSLLFDDIRLKTVWDEICVQVQDDYSPYWFAYENTIINILVSKLKLFSKDELKIIWYDIIYGREHYPSLLSLNIYDKDNLEILANGIMHDYVYDLAMNYESDNIYSFLNNYFEDDEELADEEFEDD